MISVIWVDTFELNRVGQNSSETLQELVRASSSSMLVTLNSV